jgi:hypothetical protein
MELQLVSPELAIALREIGFPQEIEIGIVCRLQDKTNSLYEKTRKVDDDDIENEYCIYNEVYPVLEEAKMWFRKIHNLDVVSTSNASGWFWEIFKAANVKEGSISGGTSVACFDDEGYNASGQWDEYEEALEAGLLYVCKLVKEKQQ